MSAKRTALIAALRDGRLDEEDLGLLTGQGKVFRGAPVDEPIEKGRAIGPSPASRHNPSPFTKMQTPQPASPEQQ
ncbi:MAG: hypothetical protein ACKOZX_07755 [Gammaproteobacteria bacterium]